MRRLISIGAALMLTGCAGFSDFLADSVTANPNRPVGNSENLRRVAGEEVRLAYVGRFVPAKGVHDLLEAVRLLRERTGTAIRLDLLGSVEISFLAERIARLPIVAVFGMIERHLHEAAERDRSCTADLGREDFARRGHGRTSRFCGV